MPIFYIGMPQAEELRLPSLFLIGGYRVFFWSNEAGEPIHVHVCKGAPSDSSAKIWLTRRGGCIVANSKAKIPRGTLDDLCEIIAAQHELICSKWKAFFLVDEISFYC